MGRLAIAVDFWFLRLGRDRIGLRLAAFEGDAVDVLAGHEVQTAVGHRHAAVHLQGHAGHAAFDGRLEQPLGLLVARIDDVELAANGCQVELAVGPDR